MTGGHSITLVTSVPTPLNMWDAPFPMPKIPLIFVKGKIKLLWSVAVRGAPLANGLLLLAAVCGTPLANGKPAKGKAGER